MWRGCARVVLAVSIGVTHTDVAKAAPVIEHRPIRCVVAHTHPWIQARVTDAVAVQARFRLLDSRDWYTVRLTEDEDGWVGALPQPRASLTAFAYFLEATDAATETARTEEQKVRVVAEDSGCGTEAVGPSVPEAAVTAEAPRGRPPLPKGFAAVEEESVGGKAGVFRFSARTSLLAGLGLGAAAVGVALALSKEQGSPNQIELVSSSPPPGSTISLAAMALSVRVRVKSTRDIGPGSVVVSLRPAGGPGNCVTLWSAHPGITADSPAEVAISRVLFVECAPPFTTQQAQATVRGPGETDVFGDDLPLSYSFVP